MLKGEIITTLCKGCSNVNLCIACNAAGSCRRRKNAYSLNMEIVEECPVVLPAKACHDEWTKKGSESLLPPDPQFTSGAPLQLWTLAAAAEIHPDCI